MNRPAVVPGKEPGEEAVGRAGVGDGGEVVVAPSQAREEPGGAIDQGQGQRPGEGGEHRPGEQPAPPHAGDVRGPGGEGDHGGGDCSGDDRPRGPRCHEPPPSGERRGTDARRRGHGQQTRGRHRRGPAHHGQHRRTGGACRRQGPGRGPPVTRHAGDPRRGVVTDLDARPGARARCHVHRSEAQRMGRSEEHHRVGIGRWVAAQQLGLPTALTTVSHEDVPISAHAQENLVVGRSCRSPST